MTLEEAIKELRDASDSEVRYGDKDNHYDKVMKRVEAFEMAIKALEQQSSEDCISRAYIESIVEELENICINGDDYILSLLSNIKNAPSVTPSRPRGKWIVEREEITTEDCFISYPHTKCSLCKVEVRFATNFCPCCGADMREVNNEDE